MPAAPALRLSAARLSPPGDRLSRADWFLAITFTIVAISMSGLFLRLHTLQSDKAALSRQLNELQKLSDESLAALADSRSELGWRVRRNGELLTALQEADTQITTLDGDLTAWQRKHSALANDARHTIDEFSSRSADLARIVNDESMLRHSEKLQSQAALAEADEKLRAAHSHMEQMVSYGRELERAFAGARSQISSLECDVSRARSERDSAQSALASCRSEVSSLFSQVSCLRSQVSSHQGRCQHCSR
jgi:chromosome segregation ATPase